MTATGLKRGQGQLHADIDMKRQKLYLMVSSNMTELNTVSVDTLF
jgi:hypothetical protein